MNIEHINNVFFLTFFLDEKSNNAYAKATATAQKSQGAAIAHALLILIEKTSNVKK